MSRTGIFAMIMMLVMALSGCAYQGSDDGASGSVDAQSDAVFSGATGGETIRILSGSENKELSEILAACAEQTGVSIEMTYKGSVDIMNCLKDGAEEYDAVWPASSLWISLGDDNHIVKYDASVSTTPVVFGIRQSLAEQLGFVDNEVSVQDILDKIRSGELSFCMTSATQSNSGASAYIGFLYALLGKNEALTEEDLDDEGLRTDISNLLSGVDRSSGSSDWLKDMFLEGDFDAMVNYECLIIAANEELVREGREPLYVVYPYDGLSIADSPLGYLDHGDEKKQEAFQQIQDYLLSDRAQKEIEKTGRRVGVSGVSEDNKDVFCTEWGIDTDRILSPITMPSEAVLMKALNLYQTSFRKPSLNVYCLDYSGSMEGEGRDQLVEAMSQILLQENAEKNLLQAEEDEINIVITFDNHVMNVYRASGADGASLEELYRTIENEEIGNGTDLYVALQEAFRILRTEYDLNQYTPAVILMTDGMSMEENRAAFQEEYASDGNGVPIFSIMFGSSDATQLEALAELSNARVFDGRTDLVGAFRSVKGYN